MFQPTRWSTLILFILERDQTCFNSSYQNRSITWNKKNFFFYFKRKEIVIQFDKISKQCHDLTGWKYCYESNFFFLISKLTVWLNMNRSLVWILIKYVIPYFLKLIIMMMGGWFLLLLLQLLVCTDLIHSGSKSRSRVWFRIPKCMLNTWHLPKNLWCCNVHNHKYTISSPSSLTCFLNI